MQLTAARYVGGVAGGFVATAGLIAATVAVASQPTWWPAFGAASLAAAASLLVSFAIVLPTLSAATPTLAYSLLAAGAVRTAALGLIVVVAVKAGGYSMNPTLCFAALYYAAIVAIEGGVLWTSVGRAATHNANATPAATASTLHPTRDCA